jgi:hypothetical protein
MQQLVIIGEIGYKSMKQPVIMCMIALKVGAIIPFECDCKVQLAIYPTVV